MRLFTGIAIPWHVVDALEHALAELRPAAQLRWSRPADLHITSKFIGEWPDSEVSRLQGVLAALDAPESFAVTVTGFGFLPNPNRPKIFFAGVRGDARLAELAAITDSALAPLGVKREARAYMPHLTVARIGNEDISGLRERIAAFMASDAACRELGTFHVREFHLYRSKTSPAGSTYSIVSSYALTTVTS